VVITSKVRGEIGDGPNDSGLSRYHILREAERSLRRLNTDRIDVYLIHGLDETTPVEETFGALDSLVQQGKVRYVGICNHQAWQVVKALRVQERLNAAPAITVQNPYNLLNRELEREMFPMVAEMGLGVMVYSPLAVGLLSGTYTPDNMPEENSLWGGRRRHGATRRGGATARGDAPSSWRGGNEWARARGCSWRPCRTAGSTNGGSRSRWCA